MLDSIIRPFITFLLCLVLNYAWGYVGNNSNFDKPKFVLFHFTLSQSAMTSAGVYTKDGVLVKTLWSGIRLGKGNHDATWDAINDEGKFAGFGDYIVKILSNNVSYTWEGVVGNNSNAISGSAVHQAYSQINGLTISGNYGYYINGYPEGHAGQYKFALSDPQTRISLKTPGSFSGSNGQFICSDATRVYYSGYDSFSPNNGQNWFIFASNISNDDQSSFSAGSAYTAAIGSPSYSSIIDQFTDTGLGITGIAVQKTGSYLFVSHGSFNRILAYNKTTGALVHDNSFTSPKRLAIDAADNLWIQSEKNKIQKYIVDSKTGEITPGGTFIKGTINPLALNVSPNGSTLAIIDGDSSQQIKFYNTSDGSLIKTLGQVGGYSNSPRVSNDKFYFSDSRDDNKRFGQAAFMSYAPDGSYWVGDTYNRRILHFTSSDIFIEQIMTLPHSRSCGIDANNNTRLFSDFLEFRIDYSKPIRQCWTLVNNWRFNITDDYDLEYNRLRSVTTLSNGRTYAFENSISNSNFQIIELASSGVRFTGIITPNYTLMMPNGNIRRITTRTPGSTTVVYEKTLTGFDGSNDPVYSDEATMITTPIITINDPITGGVVGTEGFNLGYTDSGNFITYDGGSANLKWASNEWHLGAIKDGIWKWKTAKGTNSNYSGPYPTDGGYDMGNTVQYPGGPIKVIENSIFWGYHGEFWKQSQCNKWQHVYDDGLLIGIFGVTGVDVGGNSSVAAPQMAGNVLTASIVKVGGDYYLYHCDESAHGGVHRWHISGLNSIQEQVISINISHQ